jgi:hypothetical protein
MIDHSAIPLTADGLPDLRRTPEHLFQAAMEIRATIQRFGPAAPSLPATLRARIAEVRAAAAAAPAPAPTRSAPPPAPAPAPRAVPDLRHATIAETDAYMRERLGSSGSGIAHAGAAQGEAHLANGDRSIGGRFTGIL